jgi:hypothetical protein
MQFQASLVRRLFLEQTHGIHLYRMNVSQSDVGFAVDKVACLDTEADARLYRMRGGLNAKGKGLPRIAATILHVAVVGGGNLFFGCAWIKPRSSTGAVALRNNIMLSLTLGSDPADFVDSFTVLDNARIDPVDSPGLFTFNGTPLANGASFSAGGPDDARLASETSAD